MLMTGAAARSRGQYPTGRERIIQGPAAASNGAKMKFSPDLVVYWKEVVALRSARKT